MPAKRSVNTGYKKSNIMWEIAARMQQLEKEHENKHGEKPQMPSQFYLIPIIIGIAGAVGLLIYFLFFT